MNIAAVTKFKQGDVYAALKRLGWTQSELARRAGINAGQVGDVLNLKHRPSLRVAEAIQVALAEAGEYIDIMTVWPESFPGFTKSVKVEQIRDVGDDGIRSLSERVDSHAALPFYPNDDDRRELEIALGGLSPKEQRIIQDRFYENKTLRGVGSEINLSADRVRQIECVALKKLRKKIESMRALGVAGAPITFKTNGN